MCQITFSTLGLKVEDSEMEHIIEETTKVKKILRLIAHKSALEKTQL